MRSTHSTNSASVHGMACSAGLRAPLVPLAQPSLRAATIHRSSAASSTQAGSATKRVLITGGNQGIGYETALALLRQRHEVTLACRDEARSAAAKAKLQSSVPGAVVHTVPLDLADLSSVRSCADRLLNNKQTFDVLINNAGVMACPKMTTKDGFEYQLGVNHLGHFLLTSLLLPSLAAMDRPARVLNVVSAAHMFGKIDFDDLMRDKQYNAWEAYGQSKLAVIMCTYELARRLASNGVDNVAVNCVNPGLVKTELGRYMPWWFGAVQLLAKSPEQGARSSVYLATSPEVEGVTSKFFVDSRPRNSSKASYDTAVASKLFDLSMQLTGAPPIPTKPARHVSIAAAPTATSAPA